MNKPPDPDRPLDPLIRACGNCLYGEPEPQTGQVVCRRFPPSAQLLMVPNPRVVQHPNEPKHIMVSQSVPPANNKHYWCWEFQHQGVVP